MFKNKFDDFISQMIKKGHAELVNSKNKNPSSSLSLLTEAALKHVSGGDHCQDCIYLSFSKSI